MRSAISRAALLVKVTTRRREAGSFSTSILWTTEAVSVEVLPVPAPARTKVEPGRIAASRCAGVRRPARASQAFGMMSVDGLAIMASHSAQSSRPFGHIRQIFEGVGHDHGSALSCRTAVA